MAKAATTDATVKLDLEALLQPLLMPIVEGGNQDDGAELAAKATLIAGILNGRNLLNYNTALTGAPDDIVRTPTQTAAVTITTANQNQGTLAMSLTTSLGNTGAVCYVEWKEQNPGTGFWAGPVFRLVDGEEMAFRLFVGDGSHHDFSLRSRATENDIRVTRVGTSSWPLGELRVGNLS